MIKNAVIVVVLVALGFMSLVAVGAEREIDGLKAQQDSLANVVINLHQQVSTCRYEKDNDEGLLNALDTALVTSTEVLNQQTAAIKALKQQRTEDHALMFQAAAQLLSCAYKLQQ